MATPSMAALYSLGSDGPAPTCTRRSSSSWRIEARAPGSSRSTIDAITCRISDRDAFWTMRSRISLWLARRVRGARSTPTPVGGTARVPDPIRVAIASSADPRAGSGWLAWSLRLANGTRDSGPWRPGGSRPARRGRAVAPGCDHYGVPLYRDEAVVLRVHKLGEADRIVTLLTRRHGRVRAVGKGVRRTSSRFGARLEPGSHIDVQLYSRLPEGQAAPGGRRALDVVQQIESLDAFGARLAGDYSRWTSAAVICETAERMTEEAEPALRLYLLVVGALRALVAGEHDPGLILDAFLIRAMASAGWEPALRECAKCSRPGPHAAFNVPAGGAVCEDCRPSGSARPQPASVSLMAALLSGDWVVADASETGIRRESSGLVAAHLQWHLERGLRSLPLVDRA